MDEARLTLTRRFRTADEAREEAETNLSAGSLWVPFEPNAERPALLRAVLVALVLPDGAALEGLRGRISCVAPNGAAVVLDDLPSAIVLTRLLGGDMPPRPSTNASLKPEDAPPLPAGIADGWEPVPSAPAPAPDFTSRPLTPFPTAPSVVTARPLTPLPTAPVVTEQPAFDAELPPDIPPPEIFHPDIPLAETPPPEMSAAEPFAPPGPGANQSSSLDFASDAGFPALRDGGADYPVPRESAPVSAVKPKAGMWDDVDGLELAMKEAPEEGAPQEPSRPMFTVRYATGADLEKAWKDELGAGRVMVTAPDPPPLDTPVEVTLLLPDVGALMLEGTVVHRAGTSVGIRLEIDGTTRSLIESALPGSGPPPVAVVPEAPPQVRRPTLELRKDAKGNAVVVVAFDSLADFRREYETNIRRGGVMVPTNERPPVRSVVEVVFSLLGGKREVKVKGEVVLHGVSGIGVQLGDIPQTTRVEIDSLLAAATPHIAAPAPALIPAAPGSVAPPRSAPATSVPSSGPAASGVRAESAPRAKEAATGFVPAGSRFEGELVEVMREAEVEGEAGVGAAIGAKASWLKVLAHLQASRSTGVLKAIRKAETKSFVVFQGRVLDTRGEPSRDDESILRVIRKHNLAKPGVLRILEKALDKVPDELDALLVSNIWTANDIDRARRWQVLERSAEVFAWEKGRFSFDPQGDHSWSRPTQGVPFGQVILHGVRSYIRASGEDLSRILRSGMDRAMRIVPDTGFEPARVGMTDKELRFWAEIDGKKTLRVLLATSPLAVSQTHRLVFALCRLGVLSLEKSSGSPATKPRESDRTEALRARAVDMKSRDIFGKLSISWMCAAVHVQGAWDAIRRELEPDLKAGGQVAQAAKEVLAIAEDAWKQLMEERTRRLQRLKLIEDPSRIEAAADMLAERAEVLRMQGDRSGAESAAQMAIDMAPRNPGFVQLLARVKAG